MTFRTVFMLLLMVASAQATTYRWTDASGNISFTDNIHSIPELYRQQAQVVEDTPQNLIPARGTVRPDKIDVKHSGRTVGENYRNEGNIPADYEPGQSETSWENKNKRHDRHRENTVVIPKTEARRAQDKVEEQLRQDRRALDANQLPARQGMDMNEENIRRTRDSLYGH